MVYSFLQEVLPRFPVMMTLTLLICIELQKVLIPQRNHVYCHLGDMYGDLKLNSIEIK